MPKSLQKTLPATIVAAVAFSVVLPTTAVRANSTASLNYTPIEDPTVTNGDSAYRTLENRSSPSNVQLTQNNQQDQVLGIGNDFKKWIKGWSQNVFYGIGELMEGAVKLLADMVSNLVGPLPLNFLMGDTVFKKIGDYNGEPEGLITPEDALQDRGLIAETGAQLAVVLDNPPNLNTAFMVKRTLANNVLNPENAYAQSGIVSGQGFYGIIELIWKLSLNIALGIALIFIVLTGFMIMFQDIPFIGPKTRVTVISALPNIFIAMFMAVFSLAIAALVFDVVGALGTIIMGMTETVAQDATTAIGGYGLAGSAVAMMMSVYIVNAFLAVMASGGIFSMILLVILLFVVLYWTFKLFIRIIKVLVALLLTVAFAPLILMVSALPGREGLRSKWFKSVVGGTVVFPAVLILMNLAFIVVQATAVSLPVAAINQNLLNVIVWPAAGLSMAGILALGFLHALTKTPDFVLDFFDTTGTIPAWNLVKGGWGDLGTGMEGVAKAGETLDTIRSKGGTKRGALTKAMVDRLPKGAQKTMFRWNPKVGGVDPVTGQPIRLQDRYGEQAEQVHIAAQQRKAEGKQWMTPEEVGKKRIKKYEDTLKDNLKAVYDQNKKDVINWLKAIDSNPTVPPHPLQGIPRTYSTIKNLILLAILRKRGITRPISVANKKVLLSYGFSYDTDDGVKKIVDGTGTEPAEIKANGDHPSPVVGNIEDKVGV